MAMAFEDLVALGPDGIQLTPGNHPTPGFVSVVVASNLPVRTHHGFSWTERRRPVWHRGTLLVAAASVHPPAASMGFEPSTLFGPDSPSPTALETMYPGEHLGSGEAIERAMRNDIPLAVDVSHIFIQREQGVMSQGTWARLQDYPNVVEVHVSANDGRRDQHQPIQRGTFGLQWAQARAQAGTPVILEGYFHRLSTDLRSRQLALLRGD